jgi:hypothetical protein
MDNKPAFDRSVFIPIFIGFASVLGICLVLFAIRLGAARVSIQSEVTNTPLKFQLLGTEPGIVFPTEAPSPTLEFSEPTATEIILPPTFTPVVVLVTPTASRQNNPVASPSPTVATLNVTYDDTDFKFNYTGDWSTSTVSGTYQNTLHISNKIGNSVQLSFVGQKIRLTYQGGPSLGTLAIKLDSLDFTLEQSSPQTLIVEWESPVLVLSSHALTITHISGGSINIDKVSVLDLGTATPTRTPTP